MNNGSICFMITTILVVIIVIWGFMDVLKKKQPEETSDTEVISRQIRGFGFLVLAQIVGVLGAALCAGSGVLKGLGAM